MKTPLTWSPLVGLAGAGMSALVLVSCSTSSVGPNKALLKEPAVAQVSSEKLSVGDGGSSHSRWLPAGMHEAVVKVQAIRGGLVEWSADGLNWTRLTVGHLLRAGERIRTDGRAVADLYLKQNGPVIRVLPNTTLDLEILRFEMPQGQPLTSLLTINFDEVRSETLLRLERGRILASVRRLPPGSWYEIETPKVTYRARTARFELGAAGKLRVREGSVEVLTGSTGWLVGAGGTFEPAKANENRQALVSKGDSQEAPTRDRR